MRKTRLVILPGVRSLNKIGCLLLFLACPTIAFKGQENREVEPLCKAQDLKEFWLQDSPWPGDLGVLVTRNNDLGPRPRLDTLTKHTSNVDAPNQKVRGVKLESHRTSPTERSIVAERRETTRRLDSSVDSRSRSQDNVPNSKRLVSRKDERVAEVRAEMNRFSDERRQLDERRASTYREDTRIVNTRERITRENRSRRDLNRMDRSNTRSVERQIGSENREGRVGTENTRRSLSLDRMTRSTENIRNDIRIRSQLQDRDVRAAPRKSDLRVDGRNIRREDAIKNTRSERNSESTSDAMRITQQGIRATAQPHEVVRTIRERMDGGVRRMESSRRDQDFRNNQRDVRGEENRRNLGEMRMERDDIRDFRLPAMGRRVTRYTGSIEDMRRTDRRARGAARDMEAKQADSRRNEDSRRETTSVERAMDRIDRNREDVRRRQTDIKNTRSLEDVERSDRRARISTRGNRREENRRNSENRMQTRSTETEMQARDSIRNGIRNTREDISEGSIRVRDSRSFRRIGDVRRETRSMEMKMDRMDENGEAVRRRQTDIRNTRSVEDVERSDRRARSSTRENRQEENRRNSENRMQTRSIEREMQAKDSIRTGIRNTREDISEGSIRVRDSRSPRSAGSGVEMRRLDRTARATSDDNRFRHVESRRIGDDRRETRSMEMKVDRMDKNREDVKRRQNGIRNTRSVEDVERSDRRARISTREHRREENRRNSENRMQTRSIEREMQVRDSIPTGIRNTREDISEGSIRVRDSRSRRSAGSDVEIRRLDRTARATSDDNRFRQVENRRIGHVRRETRSMERKVDSIQDTIDVRRENNDIQNSRLLTRNTQSVQDVRKSSTRDQALSRRGIEVRQQRTTMRRDSNRIDENNAESTEKNDVRDLLDGRRSVSRGEVDSRRTSTKRHSAGVFRDMRGSTQEAKLTRQIGRELRENGESQITRVMRRRMNPMVERATDSTRIIRSEAGRSHLSGTSYRREGEIKRETRSLKMLKPEDGYRVIDEADDRTERYVSDTGRPIVARFQRSNARSVDGLRRLERQTRLGSYDGETSQVDNRRARGSRVESRSMVREIAAMERRMDVLRSPSAEFRDSRVGSPVRLLARDSRSTENVKRAERRARIVSNERDSRLVDNRRNDEDRIRDMNQLEKILNVMSRFDDMGRSDRRAQRAGNDWDVRRVESRRYEDDRREVRSFERGTSSMEGSEQRRRISLDNRSSRLLRTRSVDDIRRSERRAEFDRETRRSEDRHNIERQRETMNFVVNMNRMEKRRTEMRRTQADARDIRSTEGMKRSGRTAQLLRAARDVRRVENVRSVDDRTERESRRVNGKPVDVRRTHSEEKNSRFTTVANSRQSDQLRNAREETRRTDRRLDERSQRDVMRRVIDIKSFDESRAETRKASVAIRSVEDVRRIERMARNNPSEIEMRRVLKNPDSRTREVRRTKIMETRDIHYPETKLTGTVKLDSTDRRTIQTVAQNAEQMYGMAQKTDYYGAAKSVVTNWLATFDLKMTDVSRLGETMMYGGILCYALFANVNKKTIF